MLPGNGSTLLTKGVARTLSVMGETDGTSGDHTVKVFALSGKKNK